MFKLSHQQITDNCASRSVFTRGQLYYRQGAVKALEYEEPGHLVARVQGTKRYLVNLIERDGSIHYHCTCAAFANYEGFCKHIVAVLLALPEQEPAGAFNSTETVLVDRLLESYSGLAAGSSSSEVELDLTIHIQHRSYNREPLIYLSLKTGEKGARKYVIRDLGRFITAVAQQKPFHFGKQFTYEPGRHIFSPGNQELLDFFVRIHEIETSPGYYEPPGLLKGKEIRLSPHLLRRLLDQLGEKAFTLQLGDEVFAGIRVAPSGPPLKFQLYDGGRGLTLELAEADEVELLTGEGDILLRGSQIYNLTGTEQADLLPLLSTIKKQNSGALQISAAQEQRFFSWLYPVIEKAAALEMAPTIQKRLYRPPLRANVYLDYDEGDVVARLEFVYGDIVIDPFTPEPESQAEVDTDRPLLIRNPAAEHEVMRFFEEAAFTVRGSAMHLEDDEQIWPFVYETVPLLQQHAAVYYSERFQQAGRKAPRFTGRAGIDWNLDLLDLELGLEGVDPGELAEVWQSLKIKRRYHRLRDGSVLPLEGEGIAQFSRLVGALELQPTDLKLETIRLPKHQALYLDGLIHDYGIASLQKSADLIDLVGRIRNPAAQDFRLPEPLDGVLRDYQATGFKWLKSLAGCGFGGILADDMGLGKTVQAIAFILSERQGSPAPAPALVIAPASLIYNWEAEINKFAPRLKAQVIAGTREERRALLSRPESADIVITSYPLLRRDISLYANLPFSCCFLDEAQYIKNPNSQTAQCARKIKAKQRFALTGTPMENSLTELWSIFQFILPGYLQSQKKFLEKYGGSASESEPAAPENGAVPLAAKVRPFILRRLKEEVLAELPPKIEHRYLSELTIDQKKLYQAYLERLRSEAQESIKGEGFNRSRIQILAGLMRLRQICCHPSLFVENYRGESAKLLQLLELLREAVEGGHRILLFSQFTGMLQLIREALDREGCGYFYLDGSTRTEERLQMVEAFNGGEKEVFLISLKAGGTGLNLTGADIVVQYDLWWNPAVEEQAAGRAHRIGQKKVVQVIRLLAKGTIEEKIYELQQKKKELIDRVIQPGEAFLSAMSESDIREVLEL